jgi:hypothetical protein
LITTADGQRTGRPPENFQQALMSRGSRIFDTASRRNATGIAERPVPAAERSARFGGGGVALMADLVDEELDALLRRPLPLCNWARR